MPSPDSGGIWGVMGGSFDPVHYGHLNLARQILNKERLTGVLFIPAFNHPFKKENTLANYSERSDMLKLALENDKVLQLFEIEKDNNLSGYTIDTLHALKKRFPKAAFHFIIGSDLIGQLKQWHRSEELLKEIKFLAGTRPNANLSDNPNEIKKNVKLVDIDKMDISASDIRSRIKQGAKTAEIKRLVPPQVADYIFDKGLYR